MKQLTLATAGFERYAKTTRRAVFLTEMERVVPWPALCGLIEPFYPKAGNGRPPVGVERMLRIYFLQQWFNLSDPAVEEALYDLLAMRDFVGIDLGREPVPDETTVCRFRHLLETHDLGRQLFDAVVEEIITALSRIRWLFVIARNSSFTYKGQAVDVKQVGRELGVRYVLEGSVRRAGHRVRITTQLIDAQSGAHLWADRFDGSLDDIFELQDEVAISVAGVIEPTLQAAEILHSAEQPTTDFTAYDLYLRALPHGLS